MQEGRPSWVTSCEGDDGKQIWKGVAGLFWRRGRCVSGCKGTGVRGKGEEMTRFFVRFWRSWGRGV